MLEQGQINKLNHQQQTNPTKTTTLTTISSHRIISKLNHREILTNNNQANNLNTHKVTIISNQLRKTTI